MKSVSSWGRLSTKAHEITTITGHDQAVEAIATATRGSGIAHGMGRSYGDVCLNSSGRLWLTTALDRFISFNDKTGRLLCESGVLLRDIQQHFIPRGWMLPVTPGTQFVTVGGAIANDVHGKNHHRFGSFGDHIQWLKLLRTDTTIIECSPREQPHWFRATVGGLGLTGVILTVELQLRPIAGPWLSIETIPYRTLAEFFHLADTSAPDWEYTVSWINTLHQQSERGLFMRANPIDLAYQQEPRQRTITIPFIPPFSFVNRLSLRLFNAVYFYRNNKTTSKPIHYHPFFYPLDRVLKWNRIYGSRGFFQHQCVIPREQGLDAIKELLAETAKSKSGSFLSVLKTFGSREAVGMMSFPKAGVTLSLDFPNRGNQTLNLLARLDKIVQYAGGRIYLAKDARMARDVFRAGYPRLNEFSTFRDPGISSDLSRRLMGY